MTQLTLDAIGQLLPSNGRRIFIGYSGGVDSHVLLHLLASAAEFRDRITAVYIHHGLQSAADNWAVHCQQQCLQLAVDFKTIKVDARHPRGESPEASARAARYAAFRELLQTDDLLLLAQHREDQMETLLLQLFRGAGIHGLASMPSSMAFGQGMLLRPLLPVARLDILKYAQQHVLQWVEDPTNQASDYDRNFLRNQVIPLLKQRWPAIDKTVSRTARHSAAAGQLLDAWASQELLAIRDAVDQSLLIDKWRQYNENQRNWLLRGWLQRFGLKPSSEAVLQAIIEQVINAGEDANPELQIQDVHLKKYRQKLFCLPHRYLQSASAAVIWPAQSPVLVMQNGYRLIRVDAGAGIDKRLWQAHTVTADCRRGGERLTLPGRSGRHSLKKLYQEAGVPPWERNIRPLIYLDGRLAAVAGLWVDEWAWRRQGDCYALSWQA
ncbi:MAG: tRNA lysidine(34) synthetase TilS [Methylococcales bacterium]|nr:tRNA lysidine(34) synthetase TilS [Methylococcales bacterium]